LEQRNFPEVACGFYWTEGSRGLGWAIDAVPTLKGGSTIGIASPPAIILPTGEIVKPDIRDLERLQGFPPEWTKKAESVTRKGHRWKLVGNAVTVDVAEWLGERLSSPGKFVEPQNVRQIVSGRSWPRVGWNVGHGRMTSDISAWPVRRKRQLLQVFLEYPTELLSARATAGFHERALKARLRFAPGFLDAVAAHRRAMENGRKVA
jgi:DNA (cytosine-5)-methyltransferase 1